MLLLISVTVSVVTITIVVTVIAIMTVVHGNDKWLDTFVHIDSTPPSHTHTRAHATHSSQTSVEKNIADEITEVTWKNSIKRDKMKILELVRYFGAWVGGWTGGCGYLLCHGRLTVSVRSEGGVVRW
jgi:hypothetical protein